MIAEEWHTADAVLHLDWLLRSLGLRDRVSILWNANNTFGFDRIPWDRLREAARITTVSRYMKHCMRNIGVDPMVIPNGLSADAFDPPDRSVVVELRRRFRDRTLLSKMARWDPDKHWLSTISIVAEMKRQGWRPLLIARGGCEAHGGDVLRSARCQGLRVIDRGWRRSGAQGFFEALEEVGDADVVNLVSHVDPEARRALFRASNAVLANSGHEPFGLVGLEAMAAGGIACTGCSGEEYAVAGHNALVLQTAEPREFLGLYQRLCANPCEARALRRAGQSTARRYAWPEVLERVLLPRVDLDQEFGLPGDAWVPFVSQVLRRHRATTSLSSLAPAPKRSSLPRSRRASRPRLKEEEVTTGTHDSIGAAAACESDIWVARHRKSSLRSVGKRGTHQSSRGASAALTAGS